MWHPRTSGIRSRLLSLVTLALVPAMALLVLNRVERRRAEVTARQQTVLSLSRLAANAQQRRVESVRDLLTVLAKAAGFHRDDDACAGILRSLVAEYPLFANIGWAGATGRITCQAVEAPAGMSIADRPYFQRAVASGAFTVGDHMYGAISRMPTVAFSYPIREGEAGPITGVLFAEIDLRVLSQSLRSNLLAPDATITIVDRHGSVLARSSDHARYVGTRLTAGDVRVLAERNELVAESNGPDGVYRVYAVSTVRDAAAEPVLFVSVGVPLGPLMAVADRQFRNDLVTLAVLGIGIFGAAWAGAEWLIRRPVSQLLRATGALGSGKLDTRAEPAYGVMELQRLGLAFNEMAEKLEQRDYHLRQGQRLEAIGQLAGGIAHDFNNLLTVIIGYAEALSARLPTGSDGAGELSELRTAADRAASLTRQLLTFSSRQVVQPRPVRLNEVVTQIKSLLTRLIGDDVRLVTNLAGDAGVVHADPAQIEQVILNLVINARDAMPVGGLVTIETRHVELGAGAGGRLGQSADPPPGRYVGLDVSDTGVGMDTATRARIFEPFFTTKGTGGTGLGLATVYGVVKQSGGHVWCESSPGQGTRFAILLPRIAALLDPSPEAITRPAGRGSETVVLVEDEASVRGLVTAVLKSGGYDVRATGDASEALAWFEQGLTASLLLTDVRMPVMSGMTLATRAAAKRPGLRVLFISGYADEVLRAAERPPASAFLQKPFTAAVLLSRVRQVLDQSAPLES